MGLLGSDLNSKIFSISNRSNWRKGWPNSTGGGGVVSFAARRSPELGFLFRRVTRRRRIIEGDQPSVDPPPIGSFGFKRIVIIPWHVVPIGKATRIHQLFFSDSVGGVAAAITKGRPPLEHQRRGHNITRRRASNRCEAVPGTDVTHFCSLSPKVGQLRPYYCEISMQEIGNGSPG